MSFKNNGHKRDPRYVFSALFLIFVGISCLLLAVGSHFSTTWSVIVGIVMLFLGVIMFKNSNEM
ncbi:MAG: hypothetical protein ACSW78_02905 [Lachnospiraceae bacterium]